MFYTVKGMTLDFASFANLFAPFAVTAPADKKFTEPGAVAPVFFMSGATAPGSVCSLLIFPRQPLPFTPGVDNTLCPEGHTQ